MPHLRDTRVRSGGQWPRFGLEVALAGAEASTVIAWHGEAAVLETAKKQLMAPTGKGTPMVKSENLSHDDDSLQKQVRDAVKQALQVKQQGDRGAEANDGAKRDWVATLVMHAHLTFVNMYDASRQVKVGGPCSLS